MFTELTQNKLILGNACQPEVRPSHICLETAKFVLLWVITPIEKIFRENVVNTTLFPRMQKPTSGWPCVAQKTSGAISTSFPGFYPTRALRARRGWSRFNHIPSSFKVVSEYVLASYYFISLLVTTFVRQQQLVRASPPPPTKTDYRVSSLHLQWEWYLFRSPGGPPHLRSRIKARKNGKTTGKFRVRKGLFTC